MFSRTNLVVGLIVQSHTSVSNLQQKAITLMTAGYTGVHMSCSRNVVAGQLTCCCGCTRPGWRLQQPRKFRISKTSSPLRRGVLFEHRQHSVGQSCASERKKVSTPNADVCLSTNLAQFRCQQPAEIRTSLLPPEPYPALLRGQRKDHECNVPLTKYDCLRQCPPHLTTR